MEIREAQSNDLSALSKLAHKTYSETFGHSMSAEELQTELQSNKSETYFKNAIEKTGNTFLIAETNNTIIGYIGLRDPNFTMTGRQPKSKDQALNGIYVDSNHQGQGIGRKLMDAAFNYPRFLNAENIYLSVWEENKPAYNFYLTYGFKLVGEREIIINDKIVGHDLVLMRPAKK